MGPAPADPCDFGVFRIDLKDDILFRNELNSRVLDFFQNVKATRRQGIELLLKSIWQGGEWFLNYILTDATYQDDTELFTIANEDHIVMVQKGDQDSPRRPPSRQWGRRICPHAGMARALRWHLCRSQYLRGDDANERHRLDPYFIANFQTTYQFRNAQFFFRLENMFGADYETYGAFFENTLDGTGIEPFLGPGAPLGAFGGIRLQF